MQISDFFKSKGWQKWDKSQWTIIILAGILLMILAIPIEDEKGGKNTVEEQKINEQVKDTVEEITYAEEIEHKLENTLAKIDGAGRVEVMITLEDSGESVVEKDNSLETINSAENDSTGGSRNENQTINNEVTVYKEQEDGQVPFIEKKMTPKIAGILVVAQGGENTQVKQNISEAVMALFQIDVNRIKVVKMNMQEEK